MKGSLLNKKWLKIKPDKNFKVKHENKKIVIENFSGTHKLLVFPKIFKFEENLNIIYKGKIKKGNAPILKFINRHKAVVAEYSINSENTLPEFLKYFLAVLYVPNNCECTIEKLDFSKQSSLFETNFDKLNGDILVVSPGYPSMDNKYNSAFVHTRVLEYKKLNWNVDVLYINDFTTTNCYEFEEVTVVKSNFMFLRTLLQSKKYKKVIIHFFDERFANVLESCDMTETKLYFYLHGAETLYKDWPLIASRYFEETTQIDDTLRNKFEIKDYYIKKYNNMKNVKWCFVTEYTKNRAEELLKIKFNNYEIIPCLIDTKLFKFVKKDVELRKKIFVLRKFDDVNSYSLDTVVRIILELSHRKIFGDLDFDIYGSGSMHDTILKPLFQFDNVKIHDTFLTHEEIKKVHDTHGIALFPTRYDSQAVSFCEAASSGCAVVTSDIRGIRQFIPKNLGVMCNTENYKEYADVIEKMYNDQEYFLKVAKEESKSVQEKFGYSKTIQKELDMYKNEKEENYFNIEKPKEVILSIIVPSYNVEKYINSTVISLIDHRNINKIEVLIVNDGSKDKTSEVAKKLEKLTNYGGGSIVRLIDKENGGHGSTINRGILEAKGKYIKVVDGDDTVDSEEFANLIDILEKEDSDVVLNNYIEDYAYSNKTNIKKIYQLLKPGVQYHFDDITYENYGFTSWGPILSCSSYKRDMLLKANFKLLEKCFYVDMELNTNIAICCDTITYYDLNIYRYLLGREGQSVSKESYKKNYKHHEKVTMQMIKIYYENYEKISESKREYILNHLIIPMITAQYYITIEYCKKREIFNDFDALLKKYGEIYNSKNICTRGVLFHRKTKGIFIRFNKMLCKIGKSIK